MSCQFSKAGRAAVSAALADYLEALAKRSKTAANRLLIDAARTAQEAVGAAEAADGAAVMFSTGGHIAAATALEEFSAKRTKREDASGGTAVVLAGLAVLGIALEEALMEVYNTAEEDLFDLLDVERGEDGVVRKKAAAE